MSNTFGMPQASAPTPDNAPAFDYVPIIGRRDRAHVKAVSLKGVSTKHGDVNTDRGRLYGAVHFDGVSYALWLYADPQKSRAVAMGMTSTLGGYFTVAQQNNSGISGRAWVASYAADEDNLVVIPTFAVDEDILANAQALSKFPGYDPTYGLAAAQARAQRQLLTSDLPAAIPHLFGGKGLSGFVPNLAGVELPDLTTLANPDDLRVGQATLAKAISCLEREHLAEWRDVGKAAMTRYAEVRASIKANNVLEQKAVAATDLTGVTFGEVDWR